TRPVKELKGFKKILLEAGDSQKIAFTLTDAELGFFDHNYEFVVEPGMFEVMIGTNSQDVLRQSFEKR
ncbi:MAG: fibronectin type III-like domain-contianing protein, partial [Bacteroidota bacterium]